MQVPRDGEKKQPEEQSDGDVEMEDAILATAEDLNMVGQGSFGRR
jgi:hypothetical protein